jgi:FlaA1/EpsC-like NDP-sugar epimerase
VLIEPVSPELVSRVTGRTESLFAADMRANAKALADAIAAARILVIGASGSIGSAVVKLLATMQPAGLVLVDLNENTLADLTRSLRSGPLRLPADFSTSAAAFGSPGFRRFLASANPFDVVFNFAALKHVRSERDPYSLMRMIETNVFAVESLLELSARPGQRLFSVSSDKAVWPTSLMGATKRWMERVLAEPSALTCTSARFANVAFSRGSLLHAFLERIEQKQPLAAPDNIKRYFISHTEAAELCLLAAFLGEPGEIFVPKLDPEHDSLSLEEATRRVLAFYDFEALPCASETEAKSFNAELGGSPHRWPCYFSPADTSGEKPYEELFYADEHLDGGRFAAIAVARLQPLPGGLLREARNSVEAIVPAREWSKSRIVDAIRLAVPELRHVERNRSLDAKF